MVSLKKSHIAAVSMPYPGKFMNMLWNMLELRAFRERNRGVGFHCASNYEGIDNVEIET